MKIIYHQNPLASIVELNEHEKLELRYKIRLEVYEELIEEAHFNLTKENSKDLKLVKRGN